MIDKEKAYYIADRYLTEYVGNLVGPTEPVFNKEKKLWVVPIFHMSRIARFRMGEMHINENGEIVHIHTDERPEKQVKETPIELTK